MDLLPRLAVLVIAVGLICLVVAARLYRRSGLPRGRVVYADVGRWERCESPLYDPTLGLTGRPDYLVRQRKRVIPVEVKSGAPEQPYRGHILQLAAYCALVEASYGVRPPYGLIHYPQGETFSLPYTAELEEELLGVLDEMREALKAEDLPPNHRDPARCRACGHAEHCGYRLDG